MIYFRAFLKRAMVGTLSVILLDCFVNKMEKDIVFPLKPKLYR